MIPLAAGDSKKASFIHRLQEIIATAGAVLERLLFWFASVLLVFLVITLFLQVLFRYVIQQPLAWSEEGARFGLVWYSMTAACIAAREGQHFLFRWATLALSARSRFWLRRISDVLVALLLLGILKFSLDYVSIVVNQTASGTGLSMAVPYAGVSFGAACLLCIYLAEIFDALLSLKTGRIASKRETFEAGVYALLTGSTTGDEKKAR
jgi:TRAP-type C4-dicarboxylate transport system permease small subunit